MMQYRTATFYLVDIILSDISNRINCLNSNGSLVVLKNQTREQ